MSVAGKIDVEGPTRHPVSVVTAHAAESHRETGTDHVWQDIIYTDSIISGARFPLLNFAKVVCSYSSSKFVMQQRDSMCRQIKTVQNDSFMNSTFIRRNKDRPYESSRCSLIYSLGYKGDNLICCSNKAPITNLICS